jgi:starvation-inducible DNA-binding protein
MTTVEQLTQVFKDNFVAYFRSHVAHVNIQGRNFYNDHKLLGKVYEDLQEQIDQVAELLRSLDAFMPDNLQDIIDGSAIVDTAVMGDADQLLVDTVTDLEILKESHENLIHVADQEGLLEISNYAQDRVLALAKFIWMLKSTLS